nr:hypothetical protein [Acidobacteriota bacterium]NIM61927.1 hypothetical protein [Acidobacteriota bacterium]NIO60611.1 hypothetical protein [Acidobacteriota bacterium]NIQ31700.1 hypothetical protein [Acidobacteriota bacterium]NIQ86970.1 hypothetical protein [Acidobacteriota bacterium]
MYEKKSRLTEDYSDLWGLTVNLSNLGGTMLRNYILDNVDLPSVINY